jgi:hypothetical protein
MGRHRLRESGIQAVGTRECLGVHHVPEIAIGRRRIFCIQVVGLQRFDDGGVLPFSRAVEERGRSVCATRAAAKGRQQGENALDAARRKHERNASDIQSQLKALEERSQAEEARWEKDKARLEAALRRARG